MTARQANHDALDWSADSWRSKSGADVVSFPDRDELARVVAQLKRFPPLVTSWEIERLRRELGEAEEGKRFVLQGGDCAESLSECGAEPITAKLKILLQMSLVLVHASKRPVTRVGRLAGQYAKPRTSPTETRDVGGRSVTLPSYFGDLVNDARFDADARRADPRRLVLGYQHAAMTLNFVRSLVEGGFADLHHPEYWDLSFFRHASLSAARRAEYERMTSNLGEGLRCMEALGERAADDLTRVEFFTSHEGLCLEYESAQTRVVPRRSGMFNLTTHLPWIGDRTRGLGGAHVEYMRGIRNPVGVKLGASATAEEVLRLSEVLNPANEAGRLVLIARLGVSNVERLLPRMVRAMKDAGRRGVWVCDPMHGNTKLTGGGVKTRVFDDIRRELELSYDIHRGLGGRMGGVHFELTGEDVAECLGGAAGVTESDLGANYGSACDPRLNYRQSLELAFLLAGKMAADAG